MSVNLVRTPYGNVTVIKTRYNGCEVIEYNPDEDVYAYLDLGFISNDYIIALCA